MEHLSIQGRKKFYEILDKVQKDLGTTWSATILNGFIKPQHEGENVCSGLPAGTAQRH